MKSETEVSDDFEAHFMANAGHHLDPPLVRETTRNYAEGCTPPAALSSEAA